MSSQTNIPINSRSMNGIITISDGGGTTIENGAITTNNLSAPNVAILNENETISGLYTFTPNLPQSSVAPTLGAQLVNKTYVDGLDGNNVKLTGNQTIAAGAIKTFTTLPQCSAAPTLAAELTNKTYVDGLDAQNVKLTGNQTIFGLKGFVTLPECSAVPTTANQLVNKTYADGVTAGLATLAGNQTFTTGVKTFTNLPECSTAATTANQLTNKTYVDTLDGQNIKISGSQTLTTGVKTFTNLPECSAVPTTANQLTNKTYVDGLDSNNVKKTGTQSVAGLKTFTEALRLNNNVNDGFLYLGTGTNEVILYETSGFGYLQTKNAMSFFTNTSGFGSASRVVITDTGLVINTGQALFLNTTGTAIIISASNLMSFYVPTSNQFNWLINNVQCAILNAGGLTLTGGLSVGNGQNVTLNNAGSTISSTATDMTYTATGASANHYFNIGASTIAGVNANGLTIQDTKVLQLGSVNTTNIQKNGTTRLDYNVPTGMTHSFRVNGAEVASINDTGIRIALGDSMIFNTPTDTLAINATGTGTGERLRLYANNTPSVVVIPTGVECAGVVNMTYGSLPTNVTTSIGYLFNTAIANNILVAGGATTLLATISNLPIGVWAISYMCGFTTFNVLPQRQKIAVGTTTTGNQVMGDNLFQVSVNDFQSAMATIYFRNTSVQSIYLNDTQNPGYTARTYAPAGNAAFFQAIRIA